jgi:hypothetical protein
MSNGIDRRAQMDAETAKALLLINGGGVVALLSLFSALVGKQGTAVFLGAILTAVLVMMFGIVLAILHNYYRRQCSLLYDQLGLCPPAGTLFGFALSEPSVCRVSRIFLGLSLCCFVAGGAFVAAVGLKNLEQLQKIGTP